MIVIDRIGYLSKMLVATCRITEFLKVLCEKSFVTPKKSQIC